VGQAANATADAHPELGEKIIRDFPFLPGADAIIRHHHEAYDGSGFPDHLSGENIPFYARLLRVADAFDHYLSPPADEEPLQPAQALEQIRMRAGIDFDPAMVEILCKSFYKHFLLY
jgi:HD-GYP domain-containing protein (c-di-GMP phosphodiesterase class II)